MLSHLTNVAAARWQASQGGKEDRCVNPDEMSHVVIKHARDAPLIAMGGALGYVKLHLTKQINGVLEALRQHNVVAGVQIEVPVVNFMQVEATHGSTTVAGASLPIHCAQVTPAGIEYVPLAFARALHSIQYVGVRVPVRH
jgi:hypothetical protein